MSQNTYLFYDIETTGLNKCFDQVLQFAAIRTDLELNELERTEINIKLNCDVIPTPQAVMTHRIGINAFSQGESEYDAMQKIHTLLNTPGTISVGYNSLGFDDTFLRFSFYRNLLSPYTHQYANSCGRMDIYPIVLLYYLFKPDQLVWPDNNLKLENINACNQLACGLAHNAMVDVEVTVALAKKLFLDKTMWSFVTDYFQKKSDEARISSCNATITIDGQHYKLGLMVNGKIGSVSQYIAPVIELGMHQHYKNQSLWLRLDDENLAKTNKNAIKATTKIFRKRLAEPPIFLSMKDRYVKLLSEERKNLLNKNINWLRENPILFNAIREFHQHEKYAQISERDIDSALYEIDFPTKWEERLFQQFHSAKPVDKLAIAKQFPNPIRQQQAVRIMGRHFLDQLSPDNKIVFAHYLQSTPVDFRGEKKLTTSQALIELETLETSATLDATQKKLLAELKEYYNKIISTHFH